VIAFTMAGATLLIVGNSANAAIVPTVPLATAANYAVLGGSTVTNTGATTVDGSLGLSPGTAITGFPPGLVLPPGTTDTTNAAAAQAQSDLTAAYVDAAGRPLDATTTADVANLTLQGGVYAGPSKGAMSLTGPLVLDGAGDPSSVFIFQTDSTLITGSASTVTLINGAQECNVFWQVGSSARLGTGSLFTGNILALTSIAVTTGVTVHGRALARNGGDVGHRHVHRADLRHADPPTTTTTAAATTTSTAPVTTTTTPPVTTVTTVPAVAPIGPLPPTGSPIGPPLLVAAFALLLGAVALCFGRAKT
jgi:Ice-binding-like